MEALYSKAVKAGDRIYFVDVKEAKNKSRYLVISETKRSEGKERKFTRSSVIIFESALSSIREALSEAAEILAEP